MQGFLRIFLERELLFLFLGLFKGFSFAKISISIHFQFLNEQIQI